MYKRIFVAIDADTAHCKPIVAKAIGIATMDGARVLVGHAIDSTALETAGT